MPVLRRITGCGCCSPVQPPLLFTSLHPLPDIFWSGTSSTIGSASRTSACAWRAPCCAVSSARAAGSVLLVCVVFATCLCTQCWYRRCSSVRSVCLCRPSSSFLVYPSASSRAAAASTPSHRIGEAHQSHRHHTPTAHTRCPPPSHPLVGPATQTDHAAHRHAPDALPHAHRHPAPIAPHWS